MTYPTEGMKRAMNGPTIRELKERIELCREVLRLQREIKNVQAEIDVLKAVQS